MRVEIKHIGCADKQRAARFVDCITRPSKQHIAELSARCDVHIPWFACCAIRKLVEIFLKHHSGICQRRRSKQR